MARSLLWLYQTDCQLYKKLNGKANWYTFNRFMSIITHAGGATFSILSILLLLLFSSGLVQTAAWLAGLSLLTSHLFVMILKRRFKRKRPYLHLDSTFITPHPLTDPSFPSGHTTAIFSITIPFMLISPFFFMILLPIAILVGWSRIVLGLHYPTDVFIGALIGTLCSLSLSSLFFL